MTSTSSVKLTIDFADPDLQPESNPNDKDEMDALTQSLYEEIDQLIEDMDEEGKVERVREEDLPDKSKPAAAGFLVGLLKAEVSVKNIKTLIQFVGTRLANKQVELEVEGNGKKLKVKVGSLAELDRVIQAAEDFINSPPKS